MIELVPEALSPEAFAPFGQVVSAGLSAGKSANQGTAVRFDWTCRFVNTRDGARPNLSVFRSEAKALPFPLKLLERHPCSSQMFVPMQCARYLVVVCKSGADGMPVLSELRAFVCAAGQGFNYDAGIWHHPIIALDAAAELVMLAWEDGGAKDCEEWALPEPVTIVRGG